MKIALDTSILINIIDHNNPINADEFNSWLRENDYVLVLTFFNVIEFSFPLLNSEHSNVMQGLNKIDSMPVQYIRSNLVRFELKNAFDAFLQGKEYNNFFPFVDRFDKSFATTSPTTLYITYSLGDIVWDLWTANPNVFNRHYQYIELFRQLVDLDKDGLQNSSINRDLKKEFVNTIRKHLQTANLKEPLKQIKTFAEWIYEKPTRCPSIRLGFEIYHKLVENINSNIKNGDLPDLSYLNCIPYVDLVAIDRSMRHYTKEACRKINLYEDRIIDNINDFFKGNNDKSVRL
jgi:hypothetical protein